MTEYLVKKMNDISERELSAVSALETLCKNVDGIHLRVGVEHLGNGKSDTAYLCHDGRQLIGFLSWYTSDGTEASINAMVHPGYRLRHVFHRLMALAGSEMKPRGIEKLRYRVPAGSESGIQCAVQMSAALLNSEYP